ncbi:MAG: hypothetical protein JWM59_4162 [Verrucomicrobiales bacterium]|nr:hypothetical protein [Verrucomicrobiales bacterium]
MSDYLEDSKADWTPANLAVLREILIQAYRESRRTVGTSGTPLEMNPNRMYAQGNLRWVMIDALLYHACCEGRLEGIQAKFQPNKSGPFSLELLGRSTRTLVVHLSHPEDCPPDSDLRRQARDCNQFTFSFMHDTQASDTVQLLLVHAGEKFAALRAYYDNEQPWVYEQLTGNIMEERRPVPVFETEPVSESEPQLALAPLFQETGATGHAGEKRKEDHGKGVAV